MDFGSTQPGLVADFVPDREHFISKLKSPYPQKRKRTQKESVFDWFELYGELEQLQLHWKKKQKEEERQSEMLCLQSQSCLNHASPTQWLKGTA